MKRKVLITGGMGFVGSLLSEQLSQRDDLDITVLDNLLSGIALYIDNVQVIIGDIRNKEFIENIIPEYDAIIHLAAIVGEPACVIDPSFSFDVNVMGTRNILRAIRPDQQLIFTSTSSIYGNRPNEIVTEESTPIPMNNYARQKYQSEQDIQQACKTYVIVRPVTAFGITRRTRLDLLVNTLIYNGLSFQEIEVYEPLVMRPIIHVLDFVRVLEYALDGKLVNTEVYNIGDPAYNMTKINLAVEISILTGAWITQRYEESLDPRNYDVSFKKLMATGFMFGTDRLALAVQQIKAAQYEIANAPMMYSTPYKVKLFLEREQQGV